MGDVIGLIAVVGVITTTIIIAYLFFNSRHKVRMALIQHGKEASIFKEQRNGSTGLKYGLLMTGIGCGLLIGMVLENALQTDSPVPHFAMMLILGGIGLIIYYLITKKKENEEMV